ncbi:hypothetical protein [Corynebacterium sp.]|uniref:hypothetical protein n=1 Tax=Corynebacterium sp. TaxID=1720 RepID=UPI003B3A88E2
MRLTTVARMELAAGQVHVFEPTVAPTPGDDAHGSAPSFDQARHAAAGSRPGSWMAVAFAVPPVGRGRLAAAWQTVVQRHGTLRTVLRHDGARVRVHRVRVTGGRWERAGDGTADPRTVLRGVFDVACEPFGTPSHRLAVVDHGDGTSTAVIGLDHSHTDAWSLLVLVRDMLMALAGGDAPAPVPSFAEHIRGMEHRPPAPDDIRGRWRRIMDTRDGEMPVFPLSLGDISEPRDEVVEVIDVLDTDGVARLEAAAARRSVRLLPLAVSVLTQVNRDMHAGALCAVFPVHSRRGPADDPGRWADSVGWFITNSVIECDSADPSDCATAVREAIELGSYPLEPLLRPWGGMPNTPGMFALSWLDNRRLPVQVPSEARPQHVSAWIRTDGVMAWFVLNDDGMHLRVRYPGTPSAVANVGEWAQRVAAGLRAVADGSDDTVLVGEDHDLSPVA